MIEGRKRGQKTPRSNASSPYTVPTSSANFPSGISPITSKKSASATNHHEPKTRKTQDKLGRKIHNRMVVSILKI